MDEFINVFRQLYRTLKRTLGIYTVSQKKCTNFETVYSSSKS